MQHGGSPGMVKKPVSAGSPTKRAGSPKTKFAPKGTKAKRNQTIKAGKKGSRDSRPGSPSNSFDLNRPANIQKALYEIADAASRVRDLVEFYSALHQIVGRLMAAPNFFIAIHDEQTGMLSWPYYVDEVDLLPPAPLLLKEFKGGTASVIRSGRLIHTSADARRLLTSGAVELVGTLPEDGIFVPLKMGDKVLGVLAVQNYAKGSVYTEQDVQILTFVAQHVATALTRVRAIEETRQRNAELQIINSVQQGLAAQSDIRAIYELVGNKIPDIFDAQTEFLITFDRHKNLIYRDYVIDKG